MSPSQVFHAVQGIKDGDPGDRREGFRRQGHYQIERANAVVENKQKLAAGHFYLGAAYAYRAALQYTDPAENNFDERVLEMENAFQQGIDFVGVPMRPIEVPFENTTLPGYYLEHDKSPRSVVMMVGGGDTFREDLFYFAGYPGWKRGYNVVMDFRQRGVDVTLREFTAAEGADGHSQVNNLRLAHLVIFDWLDRVFGNEPGDVRLRC